MRNGTVERDAGGAEYEYAAYWDAAESTWDALHFGGGVTTLNPKP